MNSSLFFLLKLNFLIIIVLIKKFDSFFFKYMNKERFFIKKNFSSLIQITIIVLTAISFYLFNKQAVNKKRNVIRKKLFKLEKIILTKKYIFLCYLNYCISYE